MIRILLSFLLIFSLLGSPSFAVVTEFTVKQRYGADLTQAPFFLRYSFERKYKRNWFHGTYVQRKDFLMAYDRSLEQEERDKQNKAREDLNIARDKQHRERMAYLTQQARDRQEMIDQRAEQKEYNDRQQSFADAIKTEGQEITDMQYFVRQQQQDSMSQKR